MLDTNLSLSSRELWGGTIKVKSAIARTFRLSPQAMGERSSTAPSNEDFVLEPVNASAGAEDWIEPAMSRVIASSSGGKLVRLEVCDKNVPEIQIVFHCVVEVVRLEIQPELFGQSIYPLRTGGVGNQQ